VAQRLSEQQKDAIRDDLRHTFGTTDGSVLKVAGRHDVSATSVRVLARELGLVSSESRARTKNATEAQTADLAARRARISERLVEAAERALDDMNAPAVIYNFGGKDNTYAEKPVARPPVADQRQLATIAAIALDKHRMLDQYDAQQGLSSAVDDWLLSRLGVRRGDAGEEGA
jgi:hypothetical protein